MVSRAIDSSRNVHEMKCKQSISNRCANFVDRDERAERRRECNDRGTDGPHTRGDFAYDRLVSRKSGIRDPRIGEESLWESGDINRFI